MGGWFARELKMMGSVLFILCGLAAKYSFRGINSIILSSVLSTVTTLIGDKGLISNKCP